MGHEGQQQVVQTLPALLDPIGAHLNRTVIIVTILKGRRSDASATSPDFHCQVTISQDKVRRRDNAGSAGYALHFEMRAAIASRAKPHPLI